MAFIDSHKTPVWGVVLCGGASARMGRDKASMGDPPWAHRVARVLEEAQCAPVVLLGDPPGDPADRQRLATGRWDLLGDLRPGSGPATALADHLAVLRDRGALRPAPRLVVAACDLPDVSPVDVLELIVSVAQHGGVAAYRVGGRAQLSLFAMDSATVRRIAREKVEEGTSLHDLLGDVSLLDPEDPDTVTDVDEPGGLLDPPGA